MGTRHVMWHVALADEPTFVCDTTWAKTAEDAARNVAEGTSMIRLGEMPTTYIVWRIRGRKREVSDLKAITLTPPARDSVAAETVAEWEP